MKPHTRSHRASPPADLRISLPSKHQVWVEARVKGGGYASVSEYILELIRKDQQAMARAALELKLVSALDSGLPIEAGKRYWNEKRSTMNQRMHP
jgi:antitoxin ParD1/3/4